MNTKKTKFFLSIGIFTVCLALAFIIQDTINSYLFAGIGTAAGAYTSNHLSNNH